MISKLRIKFIIISMLSVIAVLAVLIGSINIFNYRNVIKDADNILNILISNEGKFPDMKPQGQDDGPPDKPDDMRRDGMSPEMKYEVRFFTVVFDTDGGIVNVDTERIAAVDSSEAGELGISVFLSGKTKGFVGDYRFRRSDKEDSSVITFFDCGRSLDNARSFLRISVVISLIGILIVFALITVSSKAVVKPAAEALEKQKRFITDAGHELKTPLAVINADCDVLEMESADNEWLNDIRKQIERLTDLTNRLIYLAKTEEGSKKGLTKIDFPMSDCVSETLESFKSLARSSGKTIETDVTSGITFNGDQKAIEELVSILMDNAIKYSPEGGTIRASLKRNGSKIIFEVYNDTEGQIKRKDLELMFDRFYRTDESRNSETGGYGIGLSIAKSITLSHGGKIYATGKDKGITITAEL